MGICGEVNQIPSTPEFFYTKFDAYIDNKNIKNNVKLEARLLNIKGDHSCQIKLNIFTNREKTASKTGGTTELGSVDEKTDTISFQKFFVMEYYFEKEQPIEFVISGTIEAKIQTCLPNIMGSRGQIFKRTIEGTDGVILEIKGFSLEKDIINILNININMYGDLDRKGFTYEFMALENEKKEQMLYRSEGIKAFKTDKEINFKSFSIPDIYTCRNGNYEDSQVCISFDDALHKRNIGNYKGSLSSLVNKTTIVNLNENISAKIKIDAIKNYSFIDYLRGGMQINLTVAIDFTASNGKPNNEKSYHYLGAEKTQYEIAIKSCGDIVAKYDFDQKFPAYGFGGKFYGNNKASHCFPLNKNPDDPEIKGIDGILEVYREVLNNTELYGETYFHYIIDNLNKIVKQEIKDDKNIYNILMILTDGIINDMDKTIDSLVEASFLPISVIIIGIGDSDFGNMNTLDADEVPLYDRNGRKADRDLVQFVPFKDFKNDGQKLAEQVLEEVPRQIVEYYQHQNIPPGEPIMDYQIE